MKIYIGCGLTHVPRKLFAGYTNFIQELANDLRKSEEKHEVTYALLNSDPQLAKKPFHERAKFCYQWDRDLVLNSDLMVAEASFPSTGLGIEMQIAQSKGIPIVICFRDFNGNKVYPINYEIPDHSRHTLQIGYGYVTLMALGIPNVFEVVRYEDGNEGINQIIEAVKNAGRSWV